MDEFNFWQVNRYEIVKDFPTTLLAECSQAGLNMFKMGKRGYFKICRKFLVNFYDKSFHVIPCQLHIKPCEISWPVKLQDVLTSNISTKN